MSASAGTVVVIDDAPLLRAGLGAALREAGFELLGEAASAFEGVELCRATRPDIVLLDILMPGMSGLDVVEPILDASPRSRVVLLTSSESEEDLLRAIRAGARGYVVKDTPMDELVGLLAEVRAGGAVASPAMLGKLFDTLTHLLRVRDVVAARRPVLTGREIEILQVAAAGHTSREIAEKLFISENTVKNHVRNILDKLGLRSRNEAVMYALREGLIRPG